MKSIRRGVFETNSSSTHSLCITYQQILDDKPAHLTFYFGEFGWDVQTIKNCEDKASYLYTVICMFYEGEKRRKILDKIEKSLKKYNVSCNFENKSDDFYTTNKGYIDHSGGLKEFVEDVLNNEYMLINYLFSTQSFIKTGNDNCDCDISICVDYEHKEYYKGN